MIQSAMGEPGHIISAKHKGHCTDAAEKVGAKNTSAKNIGANCTNLLCSEAAVAPIAK